MGGALFDTAKDAVGYWNTRAAILTPEQIERLEDMKNEDNINRNQDRT